MYYMSHFTARAVGYGWQSHFEGSGPNIKYKQTADLTGANNIRSFPKLKRVRHRCGWHRVAGRNGRFKNYRLEQKLD